MYLLPVMNGRQADRQQTEVFGGLNRSFAIRDNEFSDMLNMSGDDYPYIAVRRNRELMSDFTEDGEKLDLIITDYARENSYDKGTGIRVYDNTFDFYERGKIQNVHKDAEIDITEADDGVSIATKVPFVFSASRFTGLVRFGNNVIAYPSPCVVNVDSDEPYRLVGVRHAYTGYPVKKKDFSGSGAGEVEFSLKRDANGGEGEYTLTLARYYASGTYFSKYYNLLDRDRYKNIMVLGRRLYMLRQSEENGQKTFDDFGVAFFVVTEEPKVSSSASGYDAITLSVKAYGYNGQLKSDIPETVLYWYKTIDNNGVYLYQLDADANLLAVHQNRLWGTDTLGTSIYCSNATDFYNWEIDGSAAGGGYLDVPENTPWTSICEYAGYLYAFKANKMYKVMGSNALDYSIIQLADVGCTNQEAVCVCDSILYFLSRDGVYAFYGSQPTCVSEVLPGEYKRGVFASRGQKLYASIERMDGVKEFLVYDSAKRVWHKEDDFSVIGFVDYTDGLYALSNNKDCYKLEAVAESRDMPFSITTKKYFYIFDQKAVSSANLYLDMGEGSSVTVQISYDGGEFVTCGTFENRRLKYIPIRLKKCDEFQIRIQGKGFVRIKQTEFVLHSGGRTIRF